jgi:hypothetical protein
MYSNGRLLEEEEFNFTLRIQQSPANHRFQVPMVLYLYPVLPTTVVFGFTFAYTWKQLWLLHEDIQLSWLQDYNSSKINHITFAEHLFV